VFYYRQLEMTENINITKTILLIPEQFQLNKPTEDCSVPSTMKIASPTNLVVPLGTDLSSL
jgi:hypothetical protein